MTPPHGPAEPSFWVIRHAGLIRAGGRVLDIAAGAGRHARFLAARGHPVVAVDRDISRIRDLGDHRLVEVVATDLEDGGPRPFDRQAFDAIVVTNYLHRPLLPELPALLSPGGVLLYETFMVGHERFGKPRNPDYLLRRGELLAAFGEDLSVVAFEQGLVTRPQPAAIQRIACARAEHRDALWPIGDAE